MKRNKTGQDESLLNALVTAVKSLFGPEKLSLEQESMLQRLEANMVLVEGGTFTMGCTEDSCSDDEKPAHAVTLSSFRIGKYEVTQEEWKLVMGDNPSKFQGPRRPVDNISWEDAQKFIRKLNKFSGRQYRLPTEAEWEYAARGGRLSKGYLYSGGNDLDSVGWFRDNATEQTHKVGQKLPNELGLYDMSGNVWEWCNDWYDGTYYAGSPDENPQGPRSGTFHVLRGGGCLTFSGGCMVSNRMSLNNHGLDSSISEALNEISGANHTGFRLVSPE